MLITILAKLLQFSDLLHNTNYKVAIPICVGYISFCSKMQRKIRHLAISLFVSLL
jgi:hypothetical protein